MDGLLRPGVGNLYYLKSHFWSERETKDLFGTAKAILALGKASRAAGSWPLAQATIIKTVILRNKSEQTPSAGEDCERWAKSMNKSSKCALCRIDIMIVPKDKNEHSSWSSDTEE